MTTTHQAQAEKLAAAYVNGDASMRRQIAEGCEEQGVLSALVVLALADAIRSDFVGRMVKTVETTT
jgi:hypothetical protein